MSTLPSDSQPQDFEEAEHLCSRRLYFTKIKVKSLFVCLFWGGVGVGRRCDGWGGGGGGGGGVCVRARACVSEGGWGWGVGGGCTHKKATRSPSSYVTQYVPASVVGSPNQLRKFHEVISKNNSATQAVS